MVITRTMLLPTTASFRLVAEAAWITCWIRWTFEANEVTIRRPFVRANTSFIPLPASASDFVVPGRSAFVESDMRQSTPFWPIAAIFPISACFPSTGVWSNLKSPVWTIAPWAVSTQTPTQSGMLWLTRKKDTGVFPNLMRELESIKRSSACL
ncbi:Uncharacterised protein [Niallia circulans]|nr:Uncharacterised protein [Niallia circulans]